MTAPLQTVAEYMAALAARHGVDIQYVGCVVGRTWLRLFRVDGDFRNVLCFVRLSDGAVHRADSWAKPGRPLGFALEVQS